MNIRKTLALLALSFTLSACAVSSTDAVTKPGVAKSGIFGMATTDPVIADGDSVYKSNQVVIGGFKVAFVELKKASAKAGMGPGGKSSAEMKLTGLTPDVMQQVTEHAYADFVAKLQAAGYSVADRGALLASDFASATHEASPKKDESSGLFSGVNSVVTYVAPASIGQIYFLAGENGKMGAFGASNPTVAAVTYGKSSKIPVLFATYTVDFANADGTVSSFALTSNLKVGQGVSVTAGSGLSLLVGDASSFSNPNGTVKLGQAIASPDAFGTVVNTDTGAGIAAEVAVNVFTSVLGAGSSQSRDYVIAADPLKYQAAASSVLVQSNTALVEKMKSLK